MTRRRDKSAVPSPSPYIPSKREQLAVDRVKERRARSAPPPKFNIEATATKIVMHALDDRRRRRQTPMSASPGDT